MLHTAILHRHTTVLHRNTRARQRLLCFPYAGGSASLYQFLPRFLPPDLLERVELLAVDYPGHGTRRGLEPPEQDFSALAELLAETLSPLFADGEVALLGCSMGGILGFEVARLIRRRASQGPRHLYVAACGAPQFPIRYPDISDPQALASYLRGLGTTPDIREIERRWSWYQAVYGLPTTYRYRETLPPLDCSISAFGGTRDSSVGLEELLGWQAQTTDRFVYHLVDGQHLFLKQLDFLAPLTRHLSQDVGLVTGALGRGGRNEYSARANDGACARSSRAS
jgi:medium-chain acyl-[acyl-carrier-protein] hydrolase